MHERLAAQIATVVARVEEVLLASAVLVIAATTVANVFCRAALGFSLAVTDEVAQVSIIVLCFAGLSYAAGKGRHIRMTAIYDQLPVRVRKPLMTLITAGTAALLFLLAWYAMEYVITVCRLGGVSPALRIPFWMLYAIAPLGLTLAGLQYALATYQNVVASGIHIAASLQEGALEPLEAKP
jgi:TRAP-type C4-dicarboxylate transport system permease small subunit